MSIARWTPAHIEELECQFPEQLDEPSSDKLLLASGKRTVVAYVRERVRHMRKVPPVD